MHKSQKFACRHAPSRTNPENLRIDKPYRTKISQLCVLTQLPPTDLKSLRSDTLISHKSQKFAFRHAYRAQILKVCVQTRSITHKSQKFACRPLYRAQIAKICVETHGIAHK